MKWLYEDCFKIALSQVSSFAFGSIPDKERGVCPSSPRAVPPKTVPAPSTKNFYSEWRLLLVEKHVLRLLSKAKQQRSRPNHAAYKLFPLQQPAFEWADNHTESESLRIFALEKEANGSRCFIATTYECFWERYSLTPPSLRHHYEVIRSESPCHLYFDLEYKVAWNPQLDGNDLIDLLLRHLRHALLVQQGVTLKDDYVLELDSSTNLKFSRHIIIQLPEHAFLNNRHDEAGSWTSFIDLGVYTRNRSFRLFLSSKAGQTAVLQPTGRFSTVTSHKKTFLKSLICNVDPSVELLSTCGDAPVSIAVPRLGRLSAEGPVNDGLAGNAQLAPSPYPDIDEFISGICSQGSVQGAVRSWILWEEVGVLLLNIKGCRYCGNIGREHKSNGIFYVVDLKGKIWYQKCYDPECRSYKSPAMPLPPHIVSTGNSGDWSLDGPTQLSQRRVMSIWSPQKVNPAKPSPQAEGNTSVLAGEDEAPDFSKELLKAVVEAERGNSCTCNFST